MRRVAMNLRLIRDTGETFAERDAHLEIDTASMQGLIDGWRSYQRLADDIGLLGSIELEIQVDDTQQHAWLVAEQAIVNEERCVRFATLANQLGHADAVEFALSQGREKRASTIGMLVELRDRATELLPRLVQIEGLPWYERLVSTDRDEPGARRP
ncbi:MAG: hypothetical protein ACREAA_03165 [Candidatus Polarisedimenticolia bacterium]